MTEREWSIAFIAFGSGGFLAALVSLPLVAIVVASWVGMFRR